MVERVACADRAFPDDHLCAGCTSLASDTDRRERFPLADLRLGDAGLRLDSVKHAWFRACRDGFLWGRQARDGCDC
ncbi:hypothetical protein D3C80_2100190 [compost metagenome]